jgi:SecD/SecF fusion protein
VAAAIGALAGSLILLSDPSRGSDCRGGARTNGVELVYRVSPRYGTERSSTIDRRLERTLDIICQRLSALQVSDGHARREGRYRILLQLPRVNRRLERIGHPGRLFFYDFEQNVIGSKRRSIRGLFKAVKRASRQKPVRDANNTTGPQLFLFSAGGALLAGPEASRRFLLSELGGIKPKRDRILKVPTGTVVLRAERPADIPESRQFNRLYVLKDNPELSGQDIRRPKQQFDQTTGEPIVTFDFTPRGRKRFHRVTRRLAERGKKLQMSGRSLADSFQTFAVVLDRQIITRPFIDFRENPNGIDGRTGAQISGGFTSVQSAHDVASFLSIDPLPIDLKLIGRRRITK